MLTRLATIACLGFCVCAQAQTFPGRHWKFEPSGLPGDIERRVDTFVHALDTTGLMVVRHGVVVYRYGDLKYVSYLASARKSVLSMLCGKYVLNGAINLNLTLADLGINDVGGLLPSEREATVYDLITARSGVYHPASNGGDDLADAPKRGSRPHGSYWLYNNWDFNAAGFAFERLTGKSVFDALQQDIAIPTGMQDFDRHRQQMLGDLTQSRYAAYHMWLSTRDMARIGYLMLRGGRWKGRQLIPADWVKKSTSAVTPVSQMNPASYRSGPFGYGYLWWVWNGPQETPSYQGAFTATGAFGQWITVLPREDLVVAHKVMPVHRGVLDSDYLRLLDRLTGKKPASEEVLPLLRRKGRAAAIDLYRRLELHPGSYIVDESDFWALGRSLTKRRQYRQAEAVLSLNLALYPGSWRSLLALARAEAAAGQRATAIQTFRLALKSNPTSTRARLGMALLGQPLDDHHWIATRRKDLDKLQARYFGPDDKYLVRRLGTHLSIEEFDPFGELQDQYEAFPFAKDSFLDAFDGSIIRFSPGRITRTPKRGPSSTAVIGPAHRP